MNAPAPIPLLDLKAQHASIREEVRAAVERVVESQVFILGPEVEGLENEVAAYSGCRHGVGVSSGTDALLVALMALGLGPGDEVITTPFTFFATAGSISRLGARPVFVDIDPLTFNLAPERVEAAITPRTRAIMPVHLYGQMVEMDALTGIAARHGLAVVEDAAQAIGAEYKGRRAGSLGACGCFSFFPSKNLGGFGDGGMVVTSDDELAGRIRLLRNHGMQPKYYYRRIGGNFRLDALQAAVLRIKLKHLDAWSDHRARNADLYRRAFEEAGVTASPADGQAGDGGIPPGKLILPVAAPWRRHIYNQFVVQVANRDEVAAALRRDQIGHEIYYPVPLHLQDCYRDLGWSEGSFPASERAARQVLALPIYPELQPASIERVVACIAKALET